jgi:hypothetical protein
MMCVYAVGCCARQMDVKTYSEEANENDKSSSGIVL